MYEKSFNTFADAEDCIRKDDEKMLFQAAVLKYNEHDFDTAIDLLSEAIRNSRDAQSKYFATRGIVYCRKSKYEQALEDYSKAIEMNPNDSYSYNNRGIALLQLGKPELALLDCNKAIKLNPTSSASFCNRGAAFIALNRLDEAIHDLDKARMLDPCNSTIYAIRGRARAMLGDCRSALEDFSQALRLSPLMISVFYDRGQVYVKLKDYVKGAHDFWSIKRMRNAEKYLELAQKSLSYIETLLHLELDSSAASRKRKKNHLDLSGCKKNCLEDLKCPITREIMEDPVIASDGHSYERAAIEMWFVKNRCTSPMTNQLLVSLELIPNHALRKLINAFCE